MAVEDIQAERAGQMGDDRLGPGLDPSGDIGDGGIGCSDDQEVDAMGGGSHIVGPPERRLDLPAGGGEGTTQRETGPTGADDA
jgi:hypothetical protein